MGLVGFTKPAQLANSDLLNGFHSGVELIDTWVAKRAAKAKARGTAVLYVSQPVDDEGIRSHIAGFYTLSAYSLQRKAISASWVTRNTPPNIPAILLGMLAVDTDYAGQGLGSSLLQDAVARAKFVAENIGAKVLVVDPITPELESFYGKYGFVRIADTAMMAVKL